MYPTADADVGPERSDTVHGWAQGLGLKEVRRLAFTTLNPKAYQ